MDEVTKTINEIERKVSGTIQHIVLCVDELVVALKKLVPQAIEKEIELKDGQIYKKDTGYFLLKYSQTDGMWDLSILNGRFYFASRESKSDMEEVITGYNFTLCPKAFVHVIPGDKE